jgi:HSP20 family protein
MDFIKIRFGNDFIHEKSKFEKNIEEMFRSMSPIFTLSEGPWKPLMDIYEAPEEIFILAEIAGVDKDDLELEINTKAVRIHGIRTGAPPAAKARFRLAEIQYGPFERVLFLPAPIDTEKVTASYTNGFLKISLVKMRFDKTRVIPVQDG